MKWLLLLLTCAGAFAEIPADSSPLTPTEQTLEFSRLALTRTSDGHGELLVQGKVWTVEMILHATPWELMTLTQTLTATLIPLSRFGGGGRLTNAWRTKLATFAASGDAPIPPAQHDLFDPDLVLWDPGFVQHKNQWGQWSLSLDRRDIVQADLPALSPLEVQQAVRILTNRTYPLAFVVENLEAFRAQLSVVPRLTEALKTQPAP